MKKILNTILVATLLVLGSTQAWGGQAHVYAYADPQVGGYVVVSDKNTMPSSFTSSTSDLEQGGWGSSGNKTFYLFYKAKDGYTFKGWYKNSSKNTATTTNSTTNKTNGWQVTQSATGVGEQASYYNAIFARIHYAGSNIVETAFVGDTKTTDIVVSHVHAGKVSCSMKSGSAGQISVAWRDGIPSSTSTELNSTLVITCNTTVAGTYTGTVVVSGNELTCEIPVSYTVYVKPTLTVTEPGSLDGAATSGEIEYTLTNPAAGYALAVTADAGDVTITDIQSNKVLFTLDQNNSGSQREITFTFKYGTITKTTRLIQLANQGASFTVSTESLTVTADDTEGSFGYTLLNPNGSEFSSSKDADWISNIQFDVVNKRVTFNVATYDNTLENRVGHITVAYGTIEHTVTVTQKKKSYSTEPFQVECDGEYITVTPADDEKKYYIIVTTESNNSTMYSIHSWKETWGYEEACDEWTWEFKVREWAEDADVFTGQQVFSHSDLGGAMGMYKGWYSYIVAHCSEPGADAERTSDFKKGRYYYDPGVRMAFTTESSMSDPPVDILHFYPEEDLDQTYYYVLLSDEEIQTIRTQAGKALTYEQIWDRLLRQNVHSEGDLMSGEHSVDRINQDPGHYHLLIRGAWYLDGVLTHHGSTFYHREFDVTVTKENDFNITPSISQSTRPDERYISITATNRGEEDYFIFAFYTQDGLDENGFEPADWLQEVGNENLYGFRSEDDYFVLNMAPNLAYYDYPYNTKSWTSLYEGYFEIDMTQEGRYGLVVAYTESDGRTIKAGTPVKTYEFAIHNTLQPVINTEDNIYLTANQTLGSIAYTISNPKPETDLTAAVTSGGDWISNVQVSATEVTFVTTTNSSHEDARAGEITLTYDDVVKVVAISQAPANDDPEIAVANTTLNVDGTAATYYQAYSINHPIADTHLAASVTRGGTWLSVSVDEANSRISYTVTAFVGDGAPREGTIALTYTQAETVELTVRQSPSAPEILDVVISVDGDITGSLSSSNVTVEEGVTATVNSNITMRNLVIKNGATVRVNSGNSLSVASIIIEGGLKTSSGYSVGRLDVATTASLSNTAGVIYYDFRINANNYYPFSVPCDVAVSAIDYKEADLASQSKYGTHYVIKRYDGLARATTGLNKNANWVVVPQTETLHAGVGYIIAAGVDAGHTSEIVRIPLNVNSVKSSVSVTAYGAGTDADEANMGWNFIGQPYLADVKASGAAYVSVPTYNFSSYEQKEASEAVLMPEWGFFVQVTSNTTITFAPKATSLPLYAPAYAKEDNNAIRAAIRLVDAQDARTRTNIIIDNAYTSAYEINADLEKMFGDAYTMEVYTLSGSQRLAFNALDETTAANVFALGYRAPVAGTYTLELDEDYAATSLGNMSRLELTDTETGIVTDLLTMPYSFETARTQSDNRFTLRAVFAPKVTTGVTASDANNDVYKELRNGVLIIRRENKVYNVLGQQE